MSFKEHVKRNSTTLLEIIALFVGLLGLFLKNIVASARDFFEFRMYCRNVFATRRRNNLPNIEWYQQLLGIVSQRKEFREILYAHYYIYTTL